jgi:hypothetical protein
MKDSDAINFVDVTSYLYDSVPVVWLDCREIFVRQQGIDFIYDKSTRSLKIQIRYTKFLGSNPAIRTTLQLLVVNNNLPPTINKDLDIWSTHSIPGTYFASHDGSIVSVARLQDNNVFCVWKILEKLLCILLRKQQIYGRGILVKLVISVFYN